jgi:hypothetical protein
MKSQTSGLLKIVIMCSIVLLMPAAIAQEKSPEILAETWVMTAKAGKQADLEKGIKKHVAHRTELKDPREWMVFSQILGNDLGSLFVRSVGFTWADMDSYESWSQKKNPQKHFNRHVDPAVSNYGHYLSSLDVTNSHWPEDTKFNFVGMTSYAVKYGHSNAMKKDLKLLSDAAKAQNWPGHWSWSESIGGRGGVNLAAPYKNYADMAPPEETFRALMIKHMGSEDQADEVLGRWISHFESAEYTIYRLRKDLM